MSRFFSSRHMNLVPYTPGEQPRGMEFIKLNTNESPFPPSKGVLDVLRSNLPERLNLYSDPSALFLREALAEYHGVTPENISVANGSDETLAFIFLAYGDKNNRFIFPDITYGIYQVVAELFGIPYNNPQLSDALKVDLNDYINSDGHIILANPNAPTGIVLKISDIEQIVGINRKRLVIIDEAYADFWGESAIPLTSKYDNLLVVRTYSKSRNMAGARLGYAVGSKELISDIEIIRNSFNPYNLNSMTLAAGVAALQDNNYYEECWNTIRKTREEVKSELKEMGFIVTDSYANFVFVKSVDFSGPELYIKLRERGILVRNLGHPRICDWLRITVGAPEQMQALTSALAAILKEAE